METKLVIRDATSDDVAMLAMTLRPIDEEEISLSSGLPVYDSILESLCLTEDPCAVDSPDGDLIGVFGVVNCRNGTGVPWLLSSEFADDYPKSIYADAQKWLAHQRCVYHELLNFVWVENHKSVRWLKRLGFTVSEPVPYGPKHTPFHPFVWRR